MSRHQAGHYAIRVQGRLDARWAAWFDGMTLTCGNEGVTLIEGNVVDQAALHGLLQKVRDTGLPLLSVEHIDTDNPRTTNPRPIAPRPITPRPITPNRRRT